MNDQAHPSNDESEKGRKPDFIAYNVKETREGKGMFYRIGAAWQHRDGEGYDLQLDSMPVNGRVTLRELREDRMQGYENDRRDQAMNGQERSSERSRQRERGR